MIQENKKIHVTMKDYKFDGNFPSQQPIQSTATIPPNKGYFSVGYMQILVPYTSATLTENSTYYLTVSDENFSATSVSNVTTSSQMSTNDDTVRTLFVRYSPGSFGQNHW